MSTEIPIVDYPKGLVPRYLPNTLFVGDGGGYGTIAEAQAAAEAAGASLANPYIVIDYTGGTYVPVDGITVVSVPPVDKPSIGGYVCSNIVRTPIASDVRFEATTGGHLSACSASYWYLPKTVKNLKIAVLNDTSDLAQDVAVTIKATIRVKNSKGDYVYYKVNFGGNRSRSVDPHALVMSDPIPTVVEGGQEIEVRLNTTALDGQEMPGTETFYQGYDGTSDLSSWSDLTDSGVAFVGETTTGCATFKPLAILGEFVDGWQPIVAAIGDSITAKGSKGTTESGCTTAHILGQATGNAHALVHTIGLAQQTPYKVMQICPSILRLFENYPIVISTMGRNIAEIWDDGTPATNPFKLQMLEWIKTLRACGIKNLYQTTITPYTQLIDAGGTTEPSNQAIVTGHTAMDTQLRACNAWIRTLPTLGVGVAGIVDWASAVTDTSGSILAWKTGAAETDGTSTKIMIHPSNYGIQLMADAVAAALPTMGLPARLTAWDNKFTADRPTGAIVILRNNEATDASAIVDYSGNAKTTDNTGTTIIKGMDTYPVRNFDGSNDKLDINVLSNPMTAATILVWMRLDSLTAGKYIVRGKNGYFRFGIGANDYLSNFSFADTVLKFEVGKWHLYGLQANRSASAVDSVPSMRCRFIRDLESHVASTATGTEALDLYDKMYVGYDGGSAFTPIKMGELLLYPRILTTTEIATYYNASKARYQI